MVAHDLHNIISWLIRPWSTSPVLFLVYRPSRLVGGQSYWGDGRPSWVESIWILEPSPEQKMLWDVALSHLLVRIDQVALAVKLGVRARDDDAMSVI